MTGYVIWKRQDNPSIRKQADTMASNASHGIRELLSRHGDEIEDEDRAYLQHAADRLDRVRGEPQEPEDELKEIEKLEKVRSTRDIIAKSQAAGPDLRGRADENARELELSYLRKHSGYHASEAAQLAQETRKHESGLDRLA